MVTEPWEIRRWMSLEVVPLPAAAFRPALMSVSDKEELLLMAAIFSAVLESMTERVTRTPRGRCEVVALEDHVPLLDQVALPLGESGSP